MSRFSPVVVQRAMTPIPESVASKLCQVGDAMLSIQAQQEHLSKSVTALFKVKRELEDITGWKFDTLS